MFKIKILLIGIVALLLFLGAVYYFVYPAFQVIERNDSLPTMEVGSIPEEEGATAEPFAYGPYPVVGTLGHPASGIVKIIQMGEKLVVRFEEFETINGPDLHIYLSKDPGAKDYIDLGPIKGTKGNINYDVPLGTNLGEYGYVLTWCEPFGVLFNYAEIR